MRTPFKLKSGNTTPFKSMGSSPVKTHLEGEHTHEGDPAGFYEMQAADVELQKMRYEEKGNPADRLARRYGGTWSKQKHEGSVVWMNQLGQLPHEAEVSRLRPSVEIGGAIVGEPERMHPSGHLK